MKIAVLETRRLILRRWQPEDIPAFARLNANREVMRYFPQVLSRGQSQQAVDRYQAHIEEHGWGFWALELKTTGDFMGFLGLNTPALNFHFSPCVEIGWRLVDRFWGHGYASEAGREALWFGFEYLRLPEVVSFTAKINQKSINVMRRLGMREVPDTFIHPSLPAEHPLGEHVLYTLLKSEWLRSVAKTGNDTIN